MPQAAAAAVFQIAGWVATNLGASSVTALKVASVAVKVSATVAKVALLAGANAVIANQNKPRPQGGMINLTLSPNEPRRLQIGQRIHAGVLADWYVTAARNSHLFLIVYLGEGPMGALKKVYAGGRVVYSTPIAHGVRTAIPDFRSGGDRLWITYYDGRPGQTADSNLVGRSVGWTSNHVGTGCAYAIIEAHWDSDVLTSPPAFSFETEGAKLYDRRKDTTAGGSGSHRLDDPSTWEVSANPAVALDHFLLGRYLGSIKTFGIGLDPDEVPYAKFAALANLCDEDVDLSSTGTQNRYEANGFLFADRSYADTIRDLCRAMNARPADFGGQVGIIDGEEKTPVLTLYDADLIENIPEQYAPKRSWGELVNTVLGTYQNPAQLYQATEYPRITDAAWVTEDGGSVKEDNLDLEMEVSAERAQRLAWLHAKRQRRQATLVGAYKLRAIELEQGDWFIRSGSAFGEEGKVFEVVDRILDPATFIVTINAFEVDPADTAWTTDIPTDPPADPTPDTSELVAMEVPDLTVTAETLTGTAAQLPAIVVEWAAPDDPRVRQIMVEAVPAAGGVPMSAVAEVGTTQIVFTNGITDDTDYLVRARFLGTFSPSEWTSNFEITTEGDYAVGAASSVPWSGVTGAGRPEDNADVTATAPAFTTEVANRISGDTTNAAAITTEASARASGDSANATSITSLTAEVSSLRVQVIPDRPAIAADFTGSTGNGTPASIAALSVGTVVNVANEGDVRQFTSDTPLVNRGWLPVISGHTYRLRTRTRVTADGTDNRLLVSFIMYNSSGTFLAAISTTLVDSSFVVADGWKDHELTITAATMLAAQPTAAFVRGNVRGGRNSSNTYSGATWQSAYSRLEDITELAALQAADTTNAAAITTEASARASGDSANASSISTLSATVSTIQTDLTAAEADILTALADAAAAQATADGKIQTFYQTSAPTAEGVGDLWFDTDDGNKQYRWSGSAWVDAQDTAIGDAISAAAGAQATADGKITTFYQTTAPTAEGEGDLWIDTDDDNKLYRWSGSAWVAVDDGRIATNAASITVTASAVADIEGRLAASYAIQVDGGGNGALISLEDGTELGSVVKLAADKIELEAAAINLGDDTTYEDTYNTFYTETASYRYRDRGPFGASGDLLVWYGPDSVALNSETKANGVFAMATDGKVYYGSAELLTVGNNQSRAKVATGSDSIADTSVWHTLASAAFTDVANPSTNKSLYVDITGQSQSGVSVGAGWTWRIVSAPSSNLTDVDVIKSGTFTLTAGGSLGGGLYDPPEVSDLTQPSAALVAATDFGSVTYMLQVQRTSGTATVGIGGTLNIENTPA